MFFLPSKAELALKTLVTRLSECKTEFLGLTMGDTAFRRVFVEIPGVAFALFREFSDKFPRKFSVALPFFPALTCQ